MVCAAVHKFAPLIILAGSGWSYASSMFVPDLETVGKAHTVPMSPKEAASMQATMRVGKVFKEFDSDSDVMIVLEGDQPLGDERPPLLRPAGQEGRGGHRARRARAGFLGGPADGGRLAEQ